MAHKKDNAKYSFLFKELNRLRNEQETDPQHIPQSELTAIDDMRKAVMDVSEKNYRYCSSN